ncbi:MAG: hypothetical protein ACOY99_10340 [Pseudomonadota bacterium]
MRIFLLVLALSALAPPAGAASTEAQRYRECAAAALRDPIPTLSQASAWRDAGGGVAAEHCLALVLATLERYEAAAQQFEQVVEHLRRGRGVAAMDAPITPALIASVLAQAGNAWLLAARYGDAYQAFSAALTEAAPSDPERVDILIDRARALALLGEAASAIADLDNAQRMAPERAEIYLDRAAAQREMGALEAAEADIANALALAPDSPDIHLEAGNIAAARAQWSEARKHWLAVLDKRVAGNAADAARANLEQLDVKSLDPR